MDELDLIDRKIVAELMRDATIPVAQIAERVGLSQTPCWKRIQKLQDSGVLIGAIPPSTVSGSVGVTAASRSATCWRSTPARGVRPNRWWRAGPPDRAEF